MNTIHLTYNLNKDPFKGMLWIQKQKVVRRPFIKFSRTMQPVKITSWRDTRKSFRQEMRLWKKLAKTHQFQAPWMLLLNNMAPKIERRRPINVMKPTQPMMMTMWRSNSSNFRKMVRSWKRAMAKGKFQATWKNMEIENYIVPKISRRREFVKAHMKPM